MLWKVSTLKAACSEFYSGINKKVTSWDVCVPKVTKPPAILLKPLSPLQTHWDQAGV